MSYTVVHKKDLLGQPRTALNLHVRSDVKTCLLTGRKNVQDGGLSNSRNDYMF